MDINLNQQQTADCLKEISNIGSTTYQNVCTGSIQTVPWGALDWVVTGVILITLISVMLTIIKLLKDGYL